MLKIRPFQGQDFDLLLELANQAVPFDPQGNEEWLEFRKALDETKYIRHHYIAEEDGESVGYGCLEQQGDDPEWLRIFVVCHPDRLKGEVGSKLYDRLLDKAKEISATNLWAREYQRDLPIREFFMDRGFVEAKRFELPGELPMVSYRLEIA